MRSPNGQRTVVAVLGMHRSGTSLTTGLLNALGVTLSEDMMPPTEANAIGYFESLGITAIQDALLAALGSSWQGSTTFRPFPASWWTLPQVLTFKEQLKSRVSEDLSLTSGVWGFKDPRTARLLPLWNDIFAELQLQPRFVLVGRHPRDVVKSLQSRDGLNSLYSELLWLEHTSAALLHTRGRELAIVDYDRWFDKPLEQARSMISALGLAMPQQDVLEEIVAKYVATDLRHHSTTADEYELPFSREIYQALLRRDRQSLDTLADLFQVASHFTNRVTNFALKSVVRA